MLSRFYNSKLFLTLNFINFFFKLKEINYWYFENNQFVETLLLHLHKPFNYVNLGLFWISWWHTVFTVLVSTKYDIKIKFFGVPQSSAFGPNFSLIHLKSLKIDKFTWVTNCFSQMILLLLFLFLFHKMALESTAEIIINWCSWSKLKPN